MIATWWVGVFLGVPLAIAARVGCQPKREPLSLLRPIAVLLGIMGLGGAQAGLLGFFLARNFGLSVQARVTPAGTAIQVVAATVG